MTVSIHPYPLIPVGKDLNGPESPSFRSFGGPRSPAVVPEGGVAQEDMFNNRSSFPRQNSGGVKRTKSLMQKIKSMVRRESEDGTVPPLPTGHRSQSMSAADSHPQAHHRRNPSQGNIWRDEPVVEEDEDDAAGRIDFSQPEGWNETSGYADATIGQRSVPVPIARRG